MEERRKRKWKKPEYGCEKGKVREEGECEIDGGGTVEWTKRRGGIEEGKEVEKTSGVREEGEERCWKGCVNGGGAAEQAKKRRWKRVRGEWKRARNGGGKGE